LIKSRSRVAKRKREEGLWSKWVKSSNQKGKGNNTAASREWRKYVDGKYATSY
jgi:hypothetical protein